jgi:hypothetical protein
MGCIGFLAVCAAEKEKSEVIEYDSQAIPAFPEQVLFLPKNCSF